MSEDLTKKLPKGDSEILNLILTTTQNLEVRFDKLEIRVEHIDSRLKRLEEKVEQRLYDTPPIWNKVVADIALLQAGQQRLEQGQEGLRIQISELDRKVSDVSRDQIVVNDVIRRIQLDFHHIDERLHKLELNRSNSST